MFGSVTLLGGKSSVTFVQEITKDLLLKDEIKHYFFNDGDAQAYTWNPFTAKPEDPPVRTGKQEELIDLQRDEGPQEKFKVLHRPTFCSMYVLPIQH